MSQLAAVARFYLEQGWAPIPAHFKSKRPIGDAWQKVRVTLDNIDVYFPDDLRNVGMLLGPVSNDLTDVDLDCPEAIAVAPHLLPATRCFGRASKRCSHWLYLTDLARVQGATKIDYRDPLVPNGDAKKALLLEVRIGGDGVGLQTIFPGSTHESGEVVEWEPYDDAAMRRLRKALENYRQAIAIGDGGGKLEQPYPYLLTCSWLGQELLARAGRVAAAALLVRYFPRQRAQAAMATLALIQLPEPWRELFVESIARALAADPVLAALPELSPQRDPHAGFPQPGSGLHQRQIAKRLICWTKPKRRQALAADVVELFGTPVVDKTVEWLGVQWGDVQTQDSGSRPMPTRSTAKKRKAIVTSVTPLAVSTIGPAAVSSAKPAIVSSPDPAVILGQMLLSEAAATLAATAEGHRNRQLYNQTVQLAKSGLIDQNAARAALAQAMQANGALRDDGARQARTTFKSGWKDGIELWRDEHPGEPDPEPPKATESDSSAAGKGDGADNGGEAKAPPSGGNRRFALDPQNPMASARTLIKAQLTRGEQQIFYRHRGSSYRWNGACYRPLTDEAVNSLVWNFLDAALRGTTEPFKPRVYHVNNVVAALKAAAQLEDATDPPAWLDDAGHLPADEMLACANGLLHLPTGELQPATPALFNTGASPVVYDPKAPPPSRWLQFLKELWPQDDEAVQALQEWFGYLLTSDTSQQKILLLIGPRRCGKGTIGRVIRELLGHEATAGPTLKKFGETFGLQSLINAMAAVIADARSGERVDKNTVAERLLSISGEDTLSVNRKYLEDWTGKIPARITILANKPPIFPDDSSALVGRYIILEIAASFYGKEDHKLLQKLRSELPGILNWAVEGYRSINKRGHFVQPKSAAEIYDDIDALGAPVKAFIAENYEVAPGRTVEAAAIWQDWREWCDTYGRDPGNDVWFGRNLKAAAPGITRRRLGARKIATYEGIGRLRSRP
jgi:putative DNA primase/helicase